MSATEVFLFGDYFAGLLAKATTTDTTIDSTDTTNSTDTTTYTTDTTTHITSSTDINTEDRNSEDYSYFGSFDIANKFLMDTIYQYLSKGQNTRRQIENFRAMVIRDGLDTNYTS